MYPFNSFMQEWSEKQKEMLDFWQGAFLPKKEGGSSKECQNCSCGNDFVSTMTKWNEMGCEAFSKSMQMFTGMPQQDLMKNISSSTAVYKNLHEFWKNLIQGFTPTGSDQMQNFFNNWQNEYTKVLSKSFSTYLPQPFQGLFKEPMEIYQMYFDLSKKFMQPWLDHSNDFTQLFEKSLFENNHDFLGFNNLWMKNYEETFGKLFKVPAFGIHKELFEKQLELMDSFMRYANNISQFYTTMQHVGMNTMKDIISEYQGMLKDDRQPKTFKEFYDYWWQKNEDAYKSLFSTDDFSKLLSQVVDAGLVLKKNYDGYLEQQLSALPLPTMSDMRSLYKSNYELKKEVRKLQKEVSELSGKNRFEK